MRLQRRRGDGGCLHQHEGRGGRTKADETGGVLLLGGAASIHTVKGECPEERHLDRGQCGGSCFYLLLHPAENGHAACTADGRKRSDRRRRQGLLRCGASVLQERMQNGRNRKQHARQGGRSHVAGR